MIYADRPLWLAYVFWCLAFIGLFGVHRMYVGKWFTGVLWLLTFGLFGVGQVFDAIYLDDMVDETNTKRILKIHGKC